MKHKLTFSDVEEENNTIHFGCEDCGEMFPSEEIERRLKKGDPHKEIHYFCYDCVSEFQEGEWL